MGVLITDPPKVTGRTFGPSQRLFTAADLAALPTSLPTGDVRYELDDGKLVILALNDDFHSICHTQIIAILNRPEAVRHGQARGSIGFVLRRNPDRVVGADAAFILKQSLPVKRSKEGYLETIPELVVEVKSKNDTDAELNDKVDEYLTAGVRIVWVLDSDKRTVTIHRSDMPVRVLTVTEMLTADGLIPDFNVPVSRLFPAS